VKNVLDYRTIISLEIEENNIFRPHIKQHAHTVYTGFTRQGAGAIEAERGAAMNVVCLP
jgi:hypothetical protein